ncbi:hypothetical protein F383_34318 [Gossypium arboreum]|uniref:Uncharacterized protein n=1 Tax=Gossypium arboreum TaxID=29729 RepID=A0A0B0PIZ9_GOSAR|nr:hypothetical protein F383_04670 [Gossypium arboreum]KHG27325.1 hypothetical protein F383_34318 [Gossypium arboreum]
MRPIIRYT